MKTLLLAVLLAAGCGSGTSGTFTARSTTDHGPSACTFSTNAKCGVIDCCEFVDRSGAHVELVCCGGSGLFIRRVCTFPGDTNNPCGQVGPNGCGVCEAVPFSVSCNVHPQAADGQPHSCGYVLDADD